ncbi:MAG: ABC transporter ATP-binding protein [Candidatus Binatia bacterium]
MGSLSVHQIVKKFGATSVLEDISFEAADGEFCVLLGPSGCGKTTLLRIIAGLESANGGTVHIDEHRVDLLPPRDRDVAFVFQNYALYPHMTVAENLGFSLRLRGAPQKEIKERIAEVARLLELGSQLDRKPQQLSGGQRQRVALGRAIVRRPKLFLFDEPLSNLDATLRSNMRVELARLHERLRATMVYVTHDQAEAMTLGEKIIVLNRGQIQQIGTPAEIYHRPGNLFVAGFVGQPQMNFIQGRVLDGSVLVAKSGMNLDLTRILLDDRLKVSPIDFTIGIRPEDLCPCSRSEAWFSGVADFVEDLGSDCFVHVMANGEKLIARAAGRTPIRRGDEVFLHSESERVHIFHGDKRVE